MIKESLRIYYYNKNFIYSIVDHPNMKEDSIKFMIREDGIYDHPN